MSTRLPFWTFLHSGKMHGLRKFMICMDLRLFFFEWHAGCCKVVPKQINLPKCTGVGNIPLDAL